MANVKETREIIVDGVTYIETIYTNGSVVRELKPEPVEPIEQDEPFDNETAMLELLSMTEYNTCLLEMQMEF